MKAHRAVGLTFDRREPLQSVRNGRRAGEECDADDTEGLMLLCTIAGLACVARGVLHSLDRSRVVATPETKRCGDIERTCEAGVVAELLEHADRGLEFRSYLGVARFGVGVYLDVGKRHRRLGGRAAIADP